MIQCKIALLGIHVPMDYINIFILYSNESLMNNVKM